jgi:hypothetical protein
VHEEVEREPSTSAAGGLPKRRRGRTLAAAERARATSRADAPRPDEAAGDLKTRAARFGDFRRAVRAAESSSETTGRHALPQPPDAEAAEPRVLPEAHDRPAVPQASEPGTTDRPELPGETAARTRPTEASPDVPTPSHPEGDTTS